MRAKLSIGGLLVATCLAGIVCGQLICRSISCRKALGLIFGRGSVLAVVDGSGIYEADVRRGTEEALNRGMMNDPGQVKIDARSILFALVANARMQEVARCMPIAHSLVDHEYHILQYQLRPEAWFRSLHANGFSTRSLRRELGKQSRARHWIEHHITPEIQVTSDECLQYYQAHRLLYRQPVRFRAIHLFLAAPPETPAEITEAKRHAIETLSERLAVGENFGGLVTVASEDEATKQRGGDLDYFSESRMPSDFLNAVKTLRVGEISPVIRTRLGFHIIQLTDKKPEREMTFEQSQPEIRLGLENLKRQAAIQALKLDLVRQADFVTTRPL